MALKYHIVFLRMMWYYGIISSCDEVSLKAVKEVLREFSLRSGNPGSTGTGSLIKYHQGYWISGFNKRLGCATNVVVELWRIRDGLILAKSKSVDFLKVETDAIVSIGLTNKADISSHEYSSLISDCRALLLEFKEAITKHSYGEGSAEQS
ncbi:hypothetical protein ACH5RR_025718 [Cinchona calisaya]|uniref:RNase H type-1 domain-containing protein n=1 Tax=Cinchona calisaya TaxID=153742 RepID=A0ABD2Z0W9_9GENT